MTKSIPLGSRLRYPITIVKLLKAAGAPVRKSEPLLQYSFKWMKEVGDHVRGETWHEEQTTIVDWDSPVEGDIQAWLVATGDVVSANRACLEVKEACSHEVQYEGLCAICGRDMTEVNYAAEIRDTARAPINMVHDQTGLTVSKVQAQRAEQELQRRLLAQRKLSLVVDLDQTIIHACIDPTVGEWQRDPANPNHEAVKHVRSFQLNDDIARGVTSGCWYYIKLRPGLETFLQRVKDKYELHVYTMGTRAYALNIAKLVDPDQKLFGNRVISRDENGNMTAKNLQRLFPVSTNMVVIIDDRADVWPRNRRNLIKVNPYDFFKGIGDINSSFLPKREDLLGAPPPDGQKNGAPATGAPATKPASSTDKVSALDELVRMSGGDDAAVTKRQIAEQEKTLEQQIKERPLAHLQEELDKIDDKSDKPETDTQSSDETVAAAPPPRHHLLLDEDRELSHLEQHLTQLHQLYFDAYDEHCARAQAPTHNTTTVDLSAVPDVGEVLESIKGHALRGVHILLSGIIPQGVNIRTSEIGLQLVSFGAELRDRVTKDVTHLVASHATPRTQKVRHARKMPSIKIVNQDWLTACLTQWTKVDETPYLIPAHPDDMACSADDTVSVSEEEGEEEGEEDEDEEEEDEEDRPARPARPRSRIMRVNELRVKIVNDAGRTVEPGADEDEVEEYDPGLAPPPIEPGQMSPIDELKSFNWESADAELDDFLNSSGDEDDDEGGGKKETPAAGASSSSSSSSSKKRKHDDEADAADDDDDDDDESFVANAKAEASSKGHKKPRPANYDAGSLPTPQGVEDEVPLLPKPAEADGGADDSFGFDEDELEKELEKELLEEAETEMEWRSGRLDA